MINFSLHPFTNISLFSKAVLESRLLSSNSSVLVIHDWERASYKSMVSDIGYRLEMDIEF